MRGLHIRQHSGSKLGNTLRSRAPFVTLVLLVCVILSPLATRIPILPAALQACPHSAPPFETETAPVTLRTRRAPIPTTSFVERAGHLYYPTSLVTLVSLDPAPKELEFEFGDALRSTVFAETEEQETLHPITHLIKLAEEKWEGMVSSQSQTLEDAVVEYKRRYGRAPPRGFDAWYAFAIKHKVPLIDEYDQIAADVEPFFALAPSTIRARQHFLVNDTRSGQTGSSFTLKISNGTSEVIGAQRQSGRAWDANLLVARFIKHLPDMELTFTSHDGPAIVLSGENKARHLEYARKGETLSLAEQDKTLEPIEFIPWNTLCPADSNARRVAMGRQLKDTDDSDSSSGPSFISLDHISAMNLCERPEIQLKHGYTAWGGPRPGYLFPLFSSAKTTMHSDFLVAPMEQYHYEIGADPEWSDKTNNRVLWRGGTTGAFHYRGGLWRGTHRARLNQVTNEQEGSRSVHFASTTSTTAPDAMHRFFAPLSTLNAKYFDVAFTGFPLQCDAADGTCSVMAKDLKFAESMTAEQQNSYKYVLDVDGNTWSGRFHRLMASNTLVFKSTIFPEWYSKRLVPWYHYVPVKNDYSDLHDIAAYFMGTPDGQHDHDAAAERIAHNGKKWTETHWREEDMAAYQFRLYLEYARLVHRDESGMEGSWDFVLS